ncbi:Minor histocompatibility antigen H13 [Habropoda laboriosa]|uniref:Minor histocompatibility antigen H13 n=1 Tax=Habropoda laboriosa TaxID=597456 RepID=A0A0L7QV39_9HYME|nr:Minor histocompatibility antigen H13 [Habropoda laboriosa]
MASEGNGIVAQASENLTESNEVITGKVPSTPEGMAIAYGSLIIMAILPIFFGSYRAVRHHKEQQQQCKKSGKQPDTMSCKEAAIFPFISSFALFGLYILYKIFAEDYINQILAGYFFFLGILALCHLTSPIISSLVPAAIPKTQYHILFTRGEGCILLCGLLFYDAFWVFGTDVMITVAKSFEVPIKLVFPQDVLEKGLTASNFAMLGLVPACLGTPLLLALAKGDWKALFSYEDHPVNANQTEQTAQTQTETKKDT